MAQRVRFIADYDCRIPGTAHDVAYKAGVEALVPDDHARAAEAAGACEILPREADGKDAGKPSRKKAAS